MATQTVEQKTFFSRSQGLVIRISKGERVLVHGELERIGEKIVEFSPIGADARYGEFGSLSTDDPEVIAKLEARAALPGSDVMTVEQYNEQLMPAAMKVEALRGENESQNRQIQEQNRIIAELQKGQKDKPITVRQ